MNAMPIKDFRIDLKVRNNQLVRRREDMGISAREASARSGVNYHTLLAYEGLRLSPLATDGVTWRESALKLAVFHGASLADLWPDAVRRIERPTATVEISGPELQQLTGQATSLPPGPDEQFDREDLSRRVAAVVDLLAPWERDVVCHRFGLLGKEEMTVAEIAAKYGRSRPAIDQALDRGLRALRSSHQTEKIVEYYDDHVAKIVVLSCRMRTDVTHALVRRSVEVLRRRKTVVLRHTADSPDTLDLLMHLADEHAFACRCERLEARNVSLRFEPWYLGSLEDGCFARRSRAMLMGDATHERASLVLRVMGGDIDESLLREARIPVLDIDQQNAKEPQP